MASAVGVRPNIRIEIQNDVNEPMEVDNADKEADVDMEDGEICDKNDPLEITIVEDALISAECSSIFDQNILTDRANRFGLKQNDSSIFPEDEFTRLLTSLGISGDNVANVRFEALHMVGIENMNTDDIFEYFCSYEPSIVEWISSNCCNVVFEETALAAKALYFTSKAIKGSPVNADCNQTGSSILLINKNREVELETDGIILSNNEDDSINVSDITVQIPDGCWRLGNEHPNATSIFIRFTFKTDIKPLKLEHFKKSTKFAMLGLISESRKRQIKGIFDRNKEIKRVDDSKNPWGDLAENWFTNESIEVPPVLLNPVIKPEVLQVQKFDVLNRLGTKRNMDDSNGSDIESKKKKVPRMRMYADEEEAKIKRKKRLLAVKMFTINTEESTKVIPDLRNIIRTGSNATNKSDESDYYSEDSDLGKKLKNRLKKRNYRNSRLTTNKEDVVIEPISIKEEKQFPTVRADRQRKEERKTRENDRHIREREKQLDNFRNKSPPPQKLPESRHTKEATPRKNIHEYDKDRYRNKMHSDKHDEQRERRHSRSHHNYDNSKTKSKVAVVLKKQKKPVVASTVWSRIDNKKERLKTASERLKTTRESSTSSDSSSVSSSSGTSSSSSSSSNGSSSESSSESEDTNDEAVDHVTQTILNSMERPGFKTSSGPAIHVDHYKKSPLRIEISNDHFRN